jgi:hypothetical protein
MNTCASCSKVYSDVLGCRCGLHIYLSDLVLERLESYTCYAVGHQVIPATGTLRLFGRDAYLDAALGGVGVTFFESLEGLEARLNGRCVAVLPEYHTFKQRWTPRSSPIAASPVRQRHAATSGGSPGTSPRGCAWARLPRRPAAYLGGNMMRGHALYACKPLVREAMPCKQYFPSPASTRARPHWP